MREALAFNSAHCFKRAARIVNPKLRSVVVSEIKLRQVSLLQMVGAAMLIHPRHTALEDRKHALDGVGWCVHPL